MKVGWELGSNLEGKKKKAQLWREAKKINPLVKYSFKDGGVYYRGNKIAKYVYFGLFESIDDSLNLEKYGTTTYYSEDNYCLEIRLSLLLNLRKKYIRGEFAGIFDHLRRAIRSMKDQIARDEFEPSDIKAVVAID